MGAFTAFAIQAAFVLAAEYIIYKWLMASSTHFALNRIALLCCYALSVCAIFISPLAFWAVTQPMAENLPRFISFAPISLVSAKPSTVESSLIALIPIIYFIGVAVALFATLRSAIKISSIIRHGEKRHLGHAILVIASTPTSPFSWGKYIVASGEDSENPLILAHELEHVRLRHSIDMAIAQVWVVFNWFNPVAYLMRRELSATHEYQVDERLLRSGTDPRQYQMLLIRKTVGHGFQSIANSLNHSQLKNRVTMMLKSRSGRVRRYAAALLAPAALLGASMADIPAVAAAISQVSAVEYGKGSDFSAPIQAEKPKMIQEFYAPAPPADPGATMTESTMPQFPGGELEMYRTLAEAIRYPESAYKDSIQGKVTVQFLVKANGSIANVSVMKSSGNAALDAEAVRATKEALNVKWIPGKVDGQPADLDFALPVMFKLQ
ncbi:MAG: M56 family metallopeptidase [Bacteroidales bacterium]|nr:M56 family metallopeptidase [Bacteroidales bacterium]